MPIVQIDLLEGRTVEQKRAMVAKVTEAIQETAVSGDDIAGLLDVCLSFKD